VLNFDTMARRCVPTSGRSGGGELALQGQLAFAGAALPSRQKTRRLLKETGRVIQACWSKALLAGNGDERRWKAGLAARQFARPFGLVDAWASCPERRAQHYLQRWPNVSRRSGPPRPKLEERLRLQVKGEAVWHGRRGWESRRWQPLRGGPRLSLFAVYLHAARHRGAFGVSCAAANSNGFRLSTIAALERSAEREEDTSVPAGL